MNKDSLPKEVGMALQKIRNGLENGPSCGHIDWRDRIAVWRAMINAFGCAESDSRRAVLGARICFKALSTWEEAAMRNSNMLKEHEYLMQPRQFLRKYVHIFLGNIEKESIDTFEENASLLLDMWRHEFEPVSAIMPAVVSASLFLLGCDSEHDGHDCIDEIWDEVIAEGYTDHDRDCCDWDDRDCYYYASCAVLGHLDQSDGASIAIRRQWWTEWINDTAYVNTKHLSVLFKDLGKYL